MAGQHSLSMGLSSVGEGEETERERRTSRYRCPAGSERKSTRGNRRLGDARFEEGQVGKVEVCDRSWVACTFIRWRGVLMTCDRIVFLACLFHFIKITVNSSTCTAAYPSLCPKSREAMLEKNGQDRYLASRLCLNPLQIKTLLNWFNLGATRVAMYFLVVRDTLESSRHTGVGHSSPSFCPVSFLVLLASVLSRTTLSLNLLFFSSRRFAGGPLHRRANKLNELHRRKGNVIQV